MRNVQVSRVAHSLAKNGISHGTKQDEQEQEHVGFRVMSFRSSHCRSSSAGFSLWVSLSPAGVRAQRNPQAEACATKVRQFPEGEAAALDPAISRAVSLR